MMRIEAAKREGNRFHKSSDLEWTNLRISVATGLRISEGFGRAFEEFNG